MLGQVAIKKGEKKKWEKEKGKIRSECQDAALLLQR